ncbi:MAG: hypothetical protein MI746_06245 [Pseudomonadales bacterium]|nr:hypothetical protein [Pseudomonadales bacterium]
MLPEHPIVISPTLAATIGLEEAVLLQTLSELIKHRGVSRPGNSRTRWIQLEDKELVTYLPFWVAADIHRVRNSLQALGIVLVEQGPVDSNYWIAIDVNAKEGVVGAKSLPSTSSVSIEDGSEQPSGERKSQKLAAVTDLASSSNRTSNLIPLDWQPDDNWIRLCKQHSIPVDFIKSLIPEFVAYWRDRGQSRFSWGNAFYKHVLKEWRQEQTRRGAYELASTMSPEWHPNQDATEILERSGISRSFIEDAVPEFVLYWRERGVVHGAWNTKFIEHIRRQWAKFTASFGVDDTPRPIPENWQPSSECYEILQLAEIDEDYARARVPEFVMYWRDSRQAKASWNTVFLQFIKMDWARRLKDLQTRGNSNAEDQAIAGSAEEKVRARLEQLADRSWAD